MSPMRIDLIFPVVPPTLDGIGDHTAHLAGALSADGCDVRILTAQEDTEVEAAVRVETAFSLPPRRGILSVTERVRADPPDWLLLQFNQFSYGRWGLNPFTPAMLWSVQRQCPSTNVAVMFHEDFLPASTWTDAVMSIWQRAQFWGLGRLADHVFFSIDPWVQQYQSWFPETPVHHLPVGSNIPRVDAGKKTVRNALGIADETAVLGVFGSLHESRLLAHIRGAAQAIQDDTDLLLLYVGPDGTAFRDSMPTLPVLDAGCLPAREVSRHFQAMDIYLAPFIDGASTRRGSFLAGLQHGLPTIGTHGPLTDSMLLDHEQDAFILTPVDDPMAFQDAVGTLCRDSTRRRTIGTNARHFFSKHFRWKVLADRLLKRLHSHKQALRSA